MTPTITIAGAGLVGPLLAISLRQRGFPVVLYERRADMRRVQVSDGRSINLAVSARGICALQQAGVWRVARHCNSHERPPDAFAHRRIDLSSLRVRRNRGYQFRFPRGLEYRAA